MYSSYFGILYKYWITPEPKPASPWPSLFPEDGEPATVTLGNAARGDAFLCDPAGKGNQMETRKPASNNSDPSPGSEDRCVQANHKITKGIVCPNTLLVAIKFGFPSALYTASLFANIFKHLSSHNVTKSVSLECSF